MSAFVTDTFTDTNATAITSHTGELGATWTRHASASNVGAPQISSNKLITTETSVNENYYASGSPASADYTVTLDYTFNNASTNEIVGPAARMTTGATNTGYFWIYFLAAGGYCLFKYVANSLTQIGSTVALTPVNGETYRTTIDVSGTTIKGRVQRLSDSQWLASSNTFGAPQVDAISQTDSGIAGAGQAGFWFSYGGGTRGTIDNFSADETGGAALPPAPISTIVRQAMKRASFY